MKLRLCRTGCVRLHVLVCADGDDATAKVKSNNRLYDRYNITFYGKACLTVQVLNVIVWTGGKQTKKLSEEGDKRSILGYFLKLGVTIRVISEPRGVN